MLQVLFPILTHLPYILLVTFFCSFVFGIGSKKNFGLPNLVSIVLIVTGVFMMIIPSLFAYMQAFSEQANRVNDVDPFKWERGVPYFTLEGSPSLLLQFGLFALIAGVVSSYFSPNQKSES